ncbi:MAG TPA: D-alanyl-D-alanine carboxypeptidase [Streptosporangiaceae bacterium]
MTDRLRLVRVAAPWVAVAVALACSAAPSARAATTASLSAGAPAGPAAGARPAEQVPAAVRSHQAATPAAAGPTGVGARGAELVNASTGKLLWGRRMNARRPMASITKVMTALVVIRAGHLQRKIRITRAEVAYVRQHDASSAGLRAGDVLTARQLLAGMLLPSGCDAAYALAQSYGHPGWRAFVRKMNATARQLHLRSTRFANFDGLPWPTEHSTYSTPHDLVALARVAMRSPVFRGIVRQRVHNLAATAQHHRYNWKTTNLLLGHFRGLIGIKTGSTDAAGYCLLFEAVRGGRELLGVVLDSSTTNPDARFSDAARALRWGFRQAG